MNTKLLDLTAEYIEASRLDPILEPNHHRPVDEIAQEYNEALNEYVSGVLAGTN